MEKKINNEQQQQLDDDDHDYDEPQGADERAVRVFHVNSFYSSNAYSLFSNHDNSIYFASGCCLKTFL